MKQKEQVKAAGDLLKETAEIKKAVQKSEDYILYGSSTRRCNIFFTIYCC